MTTWRTRTSHTLTKVTNGSSEPGLPPRLESARQLPTAVTTQSSSAVTTVISERAGDDRYLPAPVTSQSSLRERQSSPIARTAMNAVNATHSHTSPAVPCTPEACSSHTIGR